MSSPLKLSNLLRDTLIDIDRFPDRNVRVRHLLAGGRVTRLHGGQVIRRLKEIKRA
jgi:hypothetical protein